MNMKVLFILLFSFLVSGCSMFSPVKQGPDQGYVIDSVPRVSLRAKRHAKNILVLRPDTNPVYDSKRIAFSTRPHQVTYYNKHRWVALPASMLHPLIVKAFQNSRYYRSVISPPYSGDYNYSLRTQLNDLRLDFMHQTPVMQMSMQAQLIDASTNNLIASREFSAIVPLQESSPYGGALAANQATSRILASMVKWAASRS